MSGYGLTHGYSDVDDVDQDNSHEFRGHGVSKNWIAERVKSGMEKASPERAADFVGRARANASYKVEGAKQTSDLEHQKDRDHADRSYRKRRVAKYAAEEVFEGKAKPVKAHPDHHNREYVAQHAHEKKAVSGWEKWRAKKEGKV